MSVKQSNSFPTARSIRRATASKKSKAGQATSSSTARSTRTAPGPAFDPSILIDLVELREDVQNLRVAIENRVRAIVQSGNQPLVAQLSLVASLAEAEQEYQGKIEYEWALHPLAEWTETVQGLKSGMAVGTLVAYLGGDVLTAYPHHWAGTGEQRVLVADPSYQRTLAQLWAYCGVGDPALRRRKNMSSEETAAGGNQRAKKQLHIIAGSFLKSNNPRYRKVYDKAKRKYARRKDWSLGHAHNAALRRVKKEFLRDLYRAAQQVQEQGHAPSDLTGSRDARPAPDKTQAAVQSSSDQTVQTADDCRLGTSHKNGKRL
jgi:hypothetical protein